MNSFEDAVRKAAEMKPERLRLDIDDVLIMQNETPSVSLLGHIESLTQDDIDQLAAVFGWEYEVWRTEHSTKEEGWNFSIWEKSNGRVHPKHINVTTKLEAAKAAFVAIIQEVSK